MSIERRKTDGTAINSLIYSPPGCNITPAKNSKDMQIGSLDVKLIVTREALKIGDPRYEMLHIKNEGQLPAEDVILGILHRMIQEGGKNND